MSHLSPFRLNVPNLGNELSSGPPSSKKRRKNVQQSIQPTSNVQDLLPPPLSGYGDTIVASNPFDDCPSSVNSMNVVRNPPNMGMGNNMGMVNMNMCRPMGKVSIQIYLYDYNPNLYNLYLRRTWYGLPHDTQPQCPSKFAHDE